MVVVAEALRVLELTPGDLSDDATEKEVIAACRRKCDQRADCTHFVSWDNHACFTYATCLGTQADTQTAFGRLMVNTRRVQGKCDMIPVTSKWNLCAAESEDCEVSDVSVVRFGAGVSFKYALVETNSSTGVGRIACSQR